MKFITGRIRHTHEYEKTRRFPKVPTLEQKPTYSLESAHTDINISHASQFRHEEYKLMKPVYF